MNGNPQTTPSGSQPGTLSRLVHLALLRVRGADASAFLHAQFSNDLAAVSEDECQLNAYCDPKGRVLATPLVCRQTGHYSLVVATDLVDSLLRRLQMFVLRSQVILERDETPLYGLAGPGVAGFLPAAPAPGHLAQGDGFWTLGMPAGEPRYLVADSSGALGVRLADAGLTADTDGHRWRWHDIRNGWPQIQAATSGRLVPQMLNMDLLDGVSFRKGCYPGQEVVARMRYLGKLKQRMLLARCAGEAPPGPGADVVCAESGALLGTVVDAQRDAGAGCLVLAAVRYREISACRRPKWSGWRCPTGYRNSKRNLPQPDRKFRRRGSAPVRSGHALPHPRARP
jgi:hypothetical protein